MAENDDHGANVKDPAAELETERIALERERLELERRKMEIDYELKKRELDDAPKKSGLREFFTNPMALAVVAGFVTLITTIITTSLNATFNRQAESLKAHNATEASRQTLQADLIKKFVENPDKNAIRENLKFLAEAGLLPEYGDAIKRYLKESPSAPQITAPAVGHIVGTDERIPLAKTPQKVLQQFSGMGVLTAMQSIGAVQCSAFLISPTLVVSTSHCMKGIGGNEKLLSATFEPAPLAGGTRQEAIPIDVARVLVVKGSKMADIALAPLQGGGDRPFLRVASEAPKPGQAFGMVFHDSAKGWVYSTGPDCRVSNVQPDEITHLCDTGLGSAGAALISTDGVVIGMHLSTGKDGKRALRVDTLRQMPEVRAAFGELPKP